MPKQNQQIGREGFTIIEVVLVLAIAGLIFLMVFIALPALQRSQRDTSRRNDMSRVDTSLVQYQTNNSSRSNNLPVAPTGGSYYVGKDNFGTNPCSKTDQSAVACAFVRDYMNSGASEVGKANEFQDPDGVPYSVFITENYGDTGSITTRPKGNQNSTLEQDVTITTSDGSPAYTIGGKNPFSEHIVYIIPGARCDGSSIVKSEKRHFAVLYRLEGAGNYCIDDQ
ncbi:type II secretion system protein [Candidatus Saccharibacteria bacterium]|nr:type II secretion system protein [Candidatus Saccharibacteria bacterium]